MVLRNLKMFMKNMIASVNQQYGLAIYINNGVIKLIEIFRDSKRHYKISALLRTEYDKGNGNQTLFETLKKSLEQLRPHSQYVVTALPYTEIITKDIQVAAKITGKALHDFIYHNIENYFACSAEEISYDYEIFSVKKTMSEKVNLRVYAVRREKVEQIVNIMRAVGLQPKIIDVNIFALARVVNLLGYDGIKASINIDFNAIQFGVMEQDKLIFAHEEGFADPEEIMQKIENCLQFYLAVLPRPLEKIIVTGDYASDLALNDMLAAHINVPIFTAYPQSKISTTSECLKGSNIQLAPSMMIPLGLALRCFEDD
jgi:Tfp pilus assembly PilM family ATPase